MYITLLICLVYFPPPVSPDTFNFFNEKLSEWGISRYGKNILILGDWNIPNFNSSSKNEKNTFSNKNIVLNTLTLFDLESCNQVSNTKGRTLDLVLYVALRIQM